MSADTMAPAGELAGDLAQQARQTWQAEPALSAADLGQRFGRSARWGRERIREARADVPTAPPAATDPDLAAGEEPVRVERLPLAEMAATGNGVAAESPEDGSYRSGSSEIPAELAAGAATWWLSVAAVVVVGAVALVMSYDHMRHLAADHGEGWRAWLLPVSVDGLMVAASLILLARRRAGLRPGLLPWASLAAGVAASVAANVAQAEPDTVARVVAAWPPLAALAGVELLVKQVRSRADRK